MLSSEQIYLYQMFLNNMMLFKCLYDEGIDLSPFNKCEIGDVNGYQQSYDLEYGNYENFKLVGEHIFEICEVYREFRGGDLQDQLNAEYWLNEAGDSCEEKFNTSMILLVIYDPLLQMATRDSIYMHDMNDSIGNIYPIEQGVVVVFDEDYGEPNWSETLHHLLMIRREMVSKEEEIYEMAI